MKITAILIGALLLTIGAHVAHAQTPASDPTAQSSPFNAPSPLATAQCKDAWFSYSQVREGTAGAMSDHR